MINMYIEWASARVPPTPFSWGMLPLLPCNGKFGSFSKQTHPQSHISKDLIDTAQGLPK